MEQSLRDMKHNIDIAVKDREGNLSSIRKQRQHYSDEIKQIRVKINSHLDTTEQRIMGDLIDVEGNVKLQSFLRDPIPSTRYKVQYWL